MPIHRSPITVINDDGSWPVTARLEKWPVGMGLTYSVDISNEVDVPIQYARALGEYLIAAADRYAPQT